MAKRKKHKLLYPPRYPRRDPRNLERMRIGGNLGRMIQRYNKLVPPALGVADEGENNGA
ncbi:unnamed protein product [marine sediment metagenome]|uniref:Uncharacterized protein n=1 Tax=marine sediment metagenome TaxID=412755 RepID=X1TMJ6_9ZZZZ